MGKVAKNENKTKSQKTFVEKTKVFLLNKLIIIFNSWTKQKKYAKILDK